MKHISLFILISCLSTLTLSQPQPQPKQPQPPQPKQPQPKQPATPPPTAARPSTVLIPLPATCAQGILPRKEIRDLTPAEWTRYSTAIRTLQTSGIYDRLVKLHLDYQTPIHNYPVFLPWHRYYVKQLELHLQRLDPSLTVPYWNWAYDAQAPETSEVLSDKYFGGNGVGARNCVMDGAFKDWRPFYPRGRHCLRRQYDLAGNAISSFYGPEVINAAINDSPAYDRFRQTIEYPIHGAVHTNIGSDFASMASPNDPLFFSHHAYVDKIWATWQQVKGSAGRRYSGRNQDGTAARAANRLWPWEVNVSGVLDIARLCYRYEDMRPRGPAPTRVQAAQEPEVGTAAGLNEPGQNGGGWWRRRLLRRSASEERAHIADAHTRSPKTMAYADPSNREEPANAPRAPAPSFSHPVVYTAPPPDTHTPRSFNVSYTDRTNLLAVRTPKPLPEWYAKMNNYDMDVLRSQEQKFGNMCMKLNQIVDYVSPSALFNQERALERLSKKVDTFYAVINGTQVVKCPTKGSGARDVKSVVRDVKQRVKRRVGGGFLNRSGNKGLGDRLRRVIGAVVHPTLAQAYPVLASPVSKRYPTGGDDYDGVDDDDEDEYCDADYDDADESYPPMQAGRMPLAAEKLFSTITHPTGPRKRTATPIATPKTAYLPPHGYQPRRAKPSGPLADGGDAYDA